MPSVPSARNAIARPDTARRPPTSWRDTLHRAPEPQVLGSRNATAQRKWSRNVTREGRRRNRRPRRFFRLLPVTPEVLSVWQRMVASLSILGKKSHDAHLVAVMQGTLGDGHFDLQRRGLQSLSGR